MNRLLGDEVILYKDGKRLIVDGKKPTHLLELLATLEPIEDTLPPTWMRDCPHWTTFGYERSMARVTDNVREFSRVPGLLVENGLASIA